MTPLVITSLAIILNFYFGIWGEVLDSFSRADILKQLLTASESITDSQNEAPTTSDLGSLVWVFRHAEALTHKQKEVFKEILDRTNKQLIQQLIPLFLLIGIATIFISHRIAGPLYRLQIGLEDISRGDLRTRIHLRKYDEAAFLALRFNRTIQNLDFALSRLKTRLNKELSKFKTSADH